MSGFLVRSNTIKLDILWLLIVLNVYLLLNHFVTQEDCIELRNEYVQALEEYPKTEFEFVIVIQVHNRLNYLKHLVKSLSVSSGISKTLLVFSHDLIDEEINRFIQNIQFCKVIQIFYPYSIQIYQTSFPGTSENDCPRNINKDEALRINCTNALHPDQYGHYREADITQIKHHWWWKANEVFSKLGATKYYNGSVLFLEEDHYVVPDFLYILKILSKLPHNIISLGFQERKRQFNFQNVEKVAITKIISNFGLAFNRTTWDMISECASTFCKYDDYNWDWSLINLSLNCLSEPFTSLIMYNSRVYHIGACGLHHSGSTCDTAEIVDEIEEKLKTAQLFPHQLRFTKINHHINLRPNGGWGDIRDHELCFNMTK